MSFNKYKVLRLDYDGKNDNIPFQYKLDINNSDLVENEISLNLDLEFEVPTETGNENKERIDLSLYIKSDKYQNVSNNFNVKRKLNLQKNEPVPESNNDDDVGSSNSLKVELDTMIDKLNKSMETHTQNIQQINNKRVYQNHLPVIEEEMEIDPKNKIIQDKMVRIYEKKLLPSLDFEINQNKVMRVYQKQLLQPQKENEIKQEKMSRVYETKVMPPPKDTVFFQDKMRRSYQDKDDDSQLFLGEMSRAYQDKRVVELNIKPPVEVALSKTEIEDEESKREIELEKKVQLLQEKILKSYKKKNNVIVNNDNEIVARNIEEYDLSQTRNLGYQPPPPSPAEQKEETNVDNSHNFISVENVLKNGRPKKQPLPEIQKQSSKNLVTLLNKNDVSMKDIELAPTTTDENVDNKLFYHLKLLLSVDSINISSNIVYIVTELMKFVDNFDLAGKDKKSVIINTIHKYLLDSNTEKNIDYIINTICPELIDILISIDRRKIKIKQKMNCFVPWCS